MSGISIGNAYKTIRQNYEAERAFSRIFEKPEKPSYEATHSTPAAEKSRLIARCLTEIKRVRAN